MTIEEQATSAKHHTSAKDAERRRKATAVVEQKTAERNTAADALATAEAACAEDPTPDAFAQARKARRELADAEADLASAHAHAAKVDGEIAAAECEAIRAEIARRTAALTELVTEEDPLRAVELILPILAFKRDLASRFERRSAELAEINALRASIGEPQDVKTPDEQAHASLVAMRTIVEPALAAQHQIGLDLGFWDGVFPAWRAFGDPSGNRRDVRAWHPDEASLGTGRPEGEAERVHAVAAKLLERAKARQGKGTTPAIIAGAAMKAAAVSAAVVAVGTALAGHG